MATRMLIDARHPEETRVAVVKGNRIEEFDFESAEHKQIKGNIYLAKVTRVEPSLQAAFVDFGGNRHGFLAFSEIHPDYYQIPAQDREALLAEEQAAADEEAALREQEDEDGTPEPADEHDHDDDEPGVEEIDTSEKDKVATIEEGQLEDSHDDDDDDSDDDDSDDDSDDGESDGDDENGDARNGNRRGRGRGRQQGRGHKGRRPQGRQSSSRGGGSRAKEIDEARAKRQALRRRYKIQDVIQRRQVLLVQVVKEERGNKGAALTSYLSLAGRYCVLMPNSSHGGGISRKISSGSDRKRLKSIVSDLSLPKSMGLIVRTAGLSRTKPEIKRDFDYLARLWDEIRERTLGSSAPAQIHSDSDLIKRAIRDIYNREIEEVIVEGEQGYKAAKQFMKLLMPSHARRVKAYNDPVPLFQRYGAEDQLSAMYEPVVQLKSGGYLVINPTEALVSIDINSGRSTKEHGIEQTALHTNLEAAREIARQLRLRDMAGLVVIDFIDMDHNSNVRKVERAMKDALKNDRARIQVGRISGFGLMEMSRQRLRTGVLEASTRECPHCDGTGLVRTASSAGLSALRVIEDEAAKGKGTVITLHASTEAAVYLLNAKRSDLAEIESRYHVTVEVKPEGEDEGAKMRVNSSGPKPSEAPRFEPIVDDEEDEVVDDNDDDDASEDAQEARDHNNTDEDGQAKKRRRRRRGGRGRNKNRNADESQSDENSSDDDGDNSQQDESPSEERGDDEGERKPRRGRRGGRGRSRKPVSDDATGAETDTATDTAAEQGSETQAAPDAEEKPKPKPRVRRAKASEAKPAAIADTDADAQDGSETEEKPKPKPRTRRKKPAVDAAETPAADNSAEAAADAEEKPKPKRKPRKKAEPKAKAEPKTKAGETAEATSTKQTTASEVPAQVKAGEGETSEGETSEGGARRGGWWQRTFGA
ncbi:Rne/Rng family ribonuclease [Aurantiacibacter marinus]|uniref:Ribonuclease E n=1 Tax=Aurantiacibacter marinus TaxID=874156 RepID=A0A0H0XPQ1_9SPHN|nr:ribonuclease E/G [Aurantiacibacter marinus]KLI63991.1 ribonuclease [Aurantiacibacter marinus]